MKSLITLCIIVVVTITLHSQKIEAESNIIGETVIRGESFSSGIGVLGVSNSRNGVVGQSVDLFGVYGTSTNNAGVEGFSQNGPGIIGFSENDHGAYFKGKETGGFADIVLGGTNWFSDLDDGVIMSDPTQSGSDIFLVANDAIVFEIGDTPSEDGTFEIWNQDVNDIIFKVYENGTVEVKGATVHGSDRNQKEEIVEIADSDILNSLIALPIYEWQYKGQKRRHIGPMAQDFHSAFGLGADNKTIASLDSDGVALAGIKALYQQNVTQRGVIEEQETRISSLERELSEIKALLKTQVLGVVED